ncbi:toxin-antitoxin system, antitoxin component [Leptospira sp. WS58.C1]
MRDEYDFSKGKPGTYSRDLKDLHFPIYLDPKLEEYYKKMAQKKNEELSTIINAITSKRIRLSGIYTLSPTLISRLGIIKTSI